MRWKTTVNTIQGSQLKTRSDLCVRVLPIQPAYSTSIQENLASYRSHNINRDNCFIISLWPSAPFASKSKQASAPNSVTTLLSAISPAETGGAQTRHARAAADTSGQQ